MKHIPKMMDDAKDERKEAREEFTRLIGEIKSAFKENSNQIEKTIEKLSDTVTRRMDNRND
jgi:hypothetical protein